MLIYCLSIEVLDEIDILKVVSLIAVVNSARQNSELNMQNCTSIEKILDLRVKVELLWMRMIGLDFLLT